PHDARKLPGREPHRWDPARFSVRRQGTDPAVAVLPPDRPRGVLPSPCVPLLGRGEPRLVSEGRGMVGADARSPYQDDRPSPQEAAEVMRTDCSKRSWRDPAVPIDVHTFGFPTGKGF